MKTILEEILNKKITTFKKEGHTGHKILNLIKGDPFHLAVLHFLYSHNTYKHCVMYGGTALKIIYDLPRMSIDLDFQIDFPLNPEGFKKDLSDYFKNKYGYTYLDVNIRKGLENETTAFWVTFEGLRKFKIPGISFTKLKIRLDFNQFETKQFQQILVPIHYDKSSFDLRTYPIATLMASKIAAVLTRTQYGNPGDNKIANYKGRDIYDLIWYLQKGVVPNLSYLKRRGLSFESYPDLFKAIRARVSGLNDNGVALRADLSSLYLEPEELDDWMLHWDSHFKTGLNNYHFAQIEKMVEVKAIWNFNSGNHSFIYRFETDQNHPLQLQVEMSQEFFEDFPIMGYQNKDLSPILGSGLSNADKKKALEFAGFFYSKIVDFLNRIKNIVPRANLRTKCIVIGYGDFDPDFFVRLTGKELEHCQFEDLL